jgi:hypothetical protein
MTTYRQLISLQNRSVDSSSKPLVRPARLLASPATPTRLYDLIAKAAEDRRSIGELRSGRSTQQPPTLSGSGETGGGSLSSATRYIVGAKTMLGRAVMVSLTRGALACLLSACSEAPAQDILGSFFPAWMLCSVVGVAATAVLRLGLGAAGLVGFIPLPALTFIIVAVAMTLLVWLICFGY